MTAVAWFKYSVAFLAVLLFRLLPFRAPNVEPLLSAIMPLSKSYGALPGLAFAILSIVLYDALTAGIGVWTLVAAVAYGLVSVGAYYYFKNRAASRSNFITFSIVSVVLYDAATGLTTGPLMYGQSLSAAASGQIPFTMLHLLGAVLFAAVVSPALYRWLASSEVFAVAPVQARARS